MYYQIACLRSPHSQTVGRVHQVVALLQHTIERADRQLVFCSDAADGEKLGSVVGTTLTEATLSDESGVKIPRTSLKQSGSQVGSHKQVRSREGSQCIGSESTRARVGSEKCNVLAGKHGKTTEVSGTESKNLVEVLREVDTVRTELGEVKQGMRDIQDCMSKMMKMMGSTPRLAA